MEEKENQRVALTKRLLQEGLLRLLEKKDLTRVNVTELCRESGINRTTFYKHYGCPNDVLAEIKEQFFQELLESQQQNIEKGHITYMEAFGHMCAYWYEHKELSKHILKNMDFNISDILTKTLHNQNWIFKHLGKNFDPESEKLASTFIGYGFYSIIRQWLLEDIEKTPKEIESIVSKLLNIDLFQ